LNLPLKLSQELTQGKTFQPILLEILNQNLSEGGSFLQHEDSQKVSFKIGPFPPSYTIYFRLFYLFTIGRKNFADVGIQTADLWCWKQPLYQLHHTTDQDSQVVCETLSK